MTTAERKRGEMFSRYRSVSSARNAYARDRITLVEFEAIVGRIVAEETR